MRHREDHGLDAAQAIEARLGTLVPIDPRAAAAAAPRPGDVEAAS